MNRTCWTEKGGCHCSSGIGHLQWQWVVKCTPELATDEQQAVSFVSGFVLDSLRVTMRCSRARHLHSGCIRKLTKYFLTFLTFYKYKKYKKVKKVKKVPDFSIVDYSFEKFMTFPTFPTFLTFWTFSGLLHNSRPFRLGFQFAYITPVIDSTIIINLWIAKNKWLQ